jgi:hypothetical protein
MPAADERRNRSDPAADPAGVAAARSRLAEAQTRLLAALVGDAEPPPGFDPERVRVQAGALVGKRREVVAKVAPALVDDLVDRVGRQRFVELFAEYTRAHPRPAEGARADAAAFAEYLRGNGLPTRGAPPSGHRKGGLARLVTRWRRR